MLKWQLRKLLNYCQFIDNITSTRKFIHNKEEVSDIKTYITAAVHIVINITHSAFPHPVKINPDKVSVGINNRAA